MRHLQRECIARMVDQHGAVLFDRPLEVAVEPGPQRGNMAPLTFIGPIGKGLGGFEALPQFGLGRFFSRNRHQAGPEAVAHDEFRIIGQGRVDFSQRVVVIAL